MRKKMQLQAEILSRAFLARRARSLDFRTGVAQNFEIAFQKESNQTPTFYATPVPKIIFHKHSSTMALKHGQTNH